MTDENKERRASRDVMWDQFMEYLPAHIKPIFLLRLVPGTPERDILDAALEALGNAIDSAKMRIRVAEKRIAPLESDDAALMKKLEAWLGSDPSCRRISIYAVDGEFNAVPGVITALMLESDQRSSVFAQVVGQATATTAINALRGAYASHVGG
jgi:hypothetical protein